MNLSKKSPAILLFLLSLLSTTGVSQNAITVSCERNGNKGYNFSYSKSVEGSYTVFVKINDANNLSETEFKGVVNGFTGYLFSSNVIERDRNFGFSTYSTSYLRGIPNPRIDTAFVYALPFRKGTSVSVNSLIDLRERFFGETPTRKMKSFQFSSNKQDTVCAIRKGIVVAIVDQFEMDTTLAISYSSRVNSILVEHPDGTLANYSGFRKGSIFVKEGQMVLPFAPLGILSQYDVEKKFSVRLGVYYLADTELGTKEDNSTKNKKISKRFYEYINPYFLTDKGFCHVQGRKKYISGFSDYVLEREMTRNELKASGKKTRTKNDLSKLKSETVLLKDTLFTDAEGNDVTSMSKAIQYSLRWTDPENEHRKIINTYYLSGKLKEEFFQVDNPQLDFKKPPHWFYKDKATGHRWYLHGLRRTWYESGQLKREVMFENGNIKGKIVTYWENGKVKRTNVDSSGNEISTKCFDDTGKEVPVYPFATTGKFDNGKTTVNDYLNKHVIYPKEAFDRLIEGNVEVVINIQPDGTVGNIRTIRSDNPLFETEIKRVIRTMPKWTTGTYDGEPVPFSNSAKYAFRLPESKIELLTKLNYKDTIFYDISGKIVRNHIYANSYEILSADSLNSKKAIDRVFAMSGKMIQEKYFLKSDIEKANNDSTLRTIGLTALSQKEIIQSSLKTEGRYREWYDNGQLGKNFTVESGVKNGNLYFYWENGNPRRTGIYDKGVLVSGDCFDKKGRKVPFFDADTPPTFQGGKEAMYKYLKANLKYPKAALQNNIQGTVNVQFVVNKTGFISRISILKSLDKELDIEAIRLIRNMPQWFPEIKDGEPIASVQTLDINFSR